ncbi:3-isopropylmalate dehydratase large subunit [Acidisphaera sp. S103]|uniref:3-isopropylmalate dehydratase large subunit n=1 Tax=Acidisphaera sp. S103 TaxID=1747223 RepID=UPI00131E27D5|nr:3-isopropylmalate dehydratase large subunit [Acidisphaera sp. S103]
MPAARTLFENVWDDHVIASSQGEDLLYVDFNYINEGQSFLAFDQLRLEGRKSVRPEQHLAVTDHYLPTINRQAGIEGIANPEIRKVVSMMANNAAEFGLPHIHMHHRRQGIAHVIGPELGISQPGMLITCNDSHTATHGAMGACAIPIGGSNQLRHVVATQTVWMKRPKTMRIGIDGTLARMVTAKDVILSIIREIGIGGGTGYAVEYAGSTIRAMAMASRMTICNMSIEGGARIGMIGPDDTTFQHLANCERAPKGAYWDRAIGYWRTLPTGDSAQFDRELTLDAAALAPMVTWGTSPEDCSPIDGKVPDPDSFSDPERRRHVARALEYMQITPAMPLSEVRVDRIFVGSCTNSRIEDLRAAAGVLKGKKASVPGMVSAGSSEIKRQAEQEGLHRIFLDAGLEWRDSGCSSCNGSNGEIVGPGQRCASTTNRNFEGRQGRAAMTHIMSPAMVAAAAVTGRLTDVRHMALA